MIVGLMAVALLGVMAMQYYFIRQSYAQKSQLFDESVRASLTVVASKAEKREVSEYARTQQKKREEFEREQRKLEDQWRIKTEIERKRKEQDDVLQVFSEQEYDLNRQYPWVVPIENDFFETYINIPQNRDLVTVTFQPVRFGDGMVEHDIEVFATRPAAHTVRAKDDSLRYLVFRSINPYGPLTLDFDIKALPPRVDVRLEREIRGLERELALLQAQTFLDTIAVMGGKNPALFHDYSIGVELAQKPLSERIDIRYIKDELTDELRSRGVISPFNLQVRDDNTILYQFASFGPGVSPEQHAENSYSARLFPEDLDRSTGLLTVSFPNKDAILMSNMSMMLLSSGALLLILIGSFAYTLFIVLRQKKMSEMKSDFINNMTHEFKTPVATIMIASETLRDPEIVADETRISRLANIIYDENVRLGNHIERVLNIARIEKENLRLDWQTVNVNELVKAVVESMDLQFKKNNVTLSMSLEADPALVRGDELHLSNVFFNLVDNAIKYSRENPEIAIATKNTPKQISIIVSDNGIGMGRDQLSKIFEQFYRVPTGNRHDVKGFGLGLSYVSDMVKRLGGKVLVKSEKEKGTTFEVVLPLHKDNS